MIPIDFPARVARVATALRGAGLDAYLSTRQAGLHYLTGAFMPWRGAVLVTADGKAEVLYWAMDASRVKDEAWNLPVHEFTGSGLPDLVRERLSAHGASRGRIGLDLGHAGSAQIAPGTLTAREYLEIQARLPDARLENGVDVLDRVLVIKEPAEIARLRRAAQIADEAIRTGFRMLRPGVRENEVAGAIEDTMRRHGSTWAWAVTGGTEVGTGDRVSYLRGVTQQSTDRTVMEGDFVIADVHPMHDLYFADTALPAVVGIPSGDQEKLAAAWQEAAETALGGLRPGVAAADVARRAFAVFERRGFGDTGLPMFGHGLGTCARMPPFMNTASQDELQANMVVALGTHLYVPRVGGCRLEYPVLITDTGAEPLSALPIALTRVPV
jgi:Xaa-Pro aminopeptidase